VIVPAVYVHCGFGAVLAALSAPLVLALVLLFPIRSYARRRARGEP